MNILRELGMNTKGENISQPTFLTNDKEIERIQCGAYFTVIEKRNGVFLVVGKLSNEQVWLLEKPKQIELGERVKQFACGSNFILFLKQNGDLWFVNFYHFSLELNFQLSQGLMDIISAGKAKFVPFTTNLHFYFLNFFLKVNLEQETKKINLNIQFFQSKTTR